MRVADKRTILKGKRAAGKALRALEAKSRSAWKGYARAIEEARRGNADALVDLLTARCKPVGDEWDLLAAFVAGKSRKAGGQARPAVHRTAVLVLALKDCGIDLTDHGLAALCKAMSREAGEPVRPDSVHVLLRSPKRLQHE